MWWGRAFWVLLLGQRVNGPSNQVPCCEHCTSLFLKSVLRDRSDPLNRELALNFLVTLAHQPNQYIRETPVDPRGWSGAGACWYPTNCGTMMKHEEKLKRAVASTCRRCRSASSASATPIGPTRTINSVSSLLPLCHHIGNLPPGCLPLSRQRRQYPWPPSFYLVTYG